MIAEETFKVIDSDYFQELILEHYKEELDVLKDLRFDPIHYHGGEDVAYDVTPGAAFVYVLDKDYNEMYKKGGIELPTNNLTEKYLNKLASDSHIPYGTYLLLS